MASGTIKTGTAKCSKERVRKGVNGWCFWSECVCVCEKVALLCQMVGGVVTKVCVSTGDVTPRTNKGCTPFWLKG